MGIVLQESRLISYMSAFDNIAVSLRVKGRSENQIRTDVTQILTWLGLTSKLFSLPRDLTDSERQRVLIARAVIGRPRLLLVDEPTTGLDDNQEAHIIHLLHELHQSGSTVIIATRREMLVNRYPGPLMIVSHNTLTETT